MNSFTATSYNYDLNHTISYQRISKPESLAIMDRILSKMNNPNQRSPITVSTNIKSKLTKYFQFSIIQQDISPNEVEMCDYDFCKICLVIKGFQSRTKI